MRKDSEVEPMESIRGWHMLRVRDYKILANAFDLIWVSDELPTSGQGKTLWWCKHCGDSFDASYRQVRDQRGCPERHVQITPPAVLQELAAQVRRIMQPDRLAFYQTFCGFFTDLSIVVNGIQIIVFLDSPQHHAKQDQQEQDNYRTQILTAAEFRVLRIRSAGLLPTPEKLEDVLKTLIVDKDVCVMTLADWKGVEWIPISHSC